MKALINEADYPGRVPTEVFVGNTKKMWIELYKNEDD